ncbi:type II and III secretion system protein [Poseidonibacter lekithochrous]|uniref:type II and III secretion system protein n=1 Tax=Poseidonibacter lekithochrous TaxID=1904463 RepID=UPI0008FC2364|nr:type II and III secretion system protein [Poseidonibacter lekithochrous]QKJ24323.1 putative Flp pilus secretin RcpA [Poseidonibacter lekithochrous]
MKTIFKILLALFVLTNLSFSNTLTNKNLYDKNISMAKGSFKVFEFEKMIMNIKVSDKESIEVDFLDDKDKPLQAIKVFSKKLGHGNILVTFIDSSSLHIDINITENLANIIEVAKILSPNLKIKQTNGKIILTGKVKDQKQKEKVLDLFAKAGVVLDKDLVDLATLQNPDKMVRVKLYAVEVNNNKGLDLKNNWFVSSKNYMEVVTKDGLYYNEDLDSTSNPNWNRVNAQRSKGVNDAIDGIMKNAVSLTGGLTGAANYLGKYFNAGLTLNYLKGNGVANILDETTLLTLENKKAEFHAGGTIYLKVQTTTDQGVPTTEVKSINYGLQLDITAKNIVNENFVSLDIVTKSTQIDWANKVDDIPSFKEKSIKTNVVIGNNSTIVLGGLVNSQNSKDVNKIPLLGDIPILGFLFTSKAFKEGKSELVFFITPEIVDANTNNQKTFLDEKTKFSKNFDFRFDDEKKADEKKKELEKQKTEKVLKVENKDEDNHQERVRQILGY